MATLPSVRAAGYFALSYRRTWRASIMTTFINPTLYLLAMGVGLGTFVDQNRHGPSLGVSYLQFVAPGLAAVAAATTAAGESMYPVMGAIKWNRTYLAMLSTPLRVADVLAGHLAWMAVRVATAVTAYLLVMVAFSATTSWQAIGVIPAGILTGMAFAAPLAAYAATQQSEGGFSLVLRLAIVPLFLFSGVFFPITQLPVGLRIVAYITPLWHGVDLCRHLTLGQAGTTSTILHVLYLAGVSAAGAGAALVTYRRRLRT